MRTSAMYFWVLVLAVSALAQENANVKVSELRASDSPLVSEFRAATTEMTPPASPAGAASPAAIATAANAKVVPNSGTPNAPAPEVSGRERGLWYALAVTDHSAAFFDAWTTRQVLSTGGRELDPLVRPFAHSSALFPALQVAPLGMDYLAAKLMRSHNRFMRRMWWAPQGVAAFGSLLCGTKNLSNIR